MGVRSEGLKKIAKQTSLPNGEISSGLCLSAQLADLTQSDSGFARQAIHVVSIIMNWLTERSGGA